MNYKNYCLATSVILGIEIENRPKSFIRTPPLYDTSFYCSMTHKYSKIGIFNLKSIMEVFKKLVLLEHAFHNLLMQM